RHVKLPSLENDLVSSALRWMNLVEPSSNAAPGNIVYPKVDLFLSTPNGSREIHYHGGLNTDPSWENLMYQMLVTIDTLESLYNDKELTAALAPPR
ncbi:MAG: hypothetical protein ABI835_10575, partial [Chloroflexota bacterium]